MDFLPFTLITPTGLHYFNRSIEEIDEKQVKVQESLGYFMFAVNLIFLSLTFGLVAPFKKLRKKMLTMAQLNIIFALILGNVGFNILSLTTKVNVDYRNYPVASLNRGCVTGVLLVQYFFLSAMFWMSASAWSLYGKIAAAVKNHGKSEKHFVRNRSILCWGGSALCPLAIYLAAWISNDRKDEYNSPYIGGNFTQGENCWVESPWKYPSFMVPTWLILLFNIFCFILVSRVIVHAAKTPNSETHQLTKIFKGMMAVSASVGLPWVIAAFTFDPFTTAAQYLFIIIVGLQGPLFFASMICLQDDIREHTIDLVGLRRFFKEKNKRHGQESTTENTTFGVSKVEPEPKRKIKSEEGNRQRRVSALENVYNAIEKAAGPCLSSLKFEYFNHKSAVPMPGRALLQGGDKTETDDTKDTTEGMPEMTGKEKTSQPKMDHDVNHTQENAASDRKEVNEGYNENFENSTATYSGEEVENDGKTNEECKNDNVRDEVERDNEDGKEKEAGQLESEDETTDEKVNINVGKTEIIYQNMGEPEQSSEDMTIDPSLVKSAYANF
ncbi:uncharacterized protein LOC134817333 isoform X2 [Bolinopsis microptera]|uniref:uncharacterized protein LOC134817333 isoform X2 n=1 Tax=Bolinopsis microptera TaxID=2820187 RepID=UPI00307AC062